MTSTGQIHGCPNPEWQYNGKVVDISSHGNDEDLICVLQNGQAIIVHLENFETKSVLNAKDLLKSCPKFVNCTSGSNHLVLLDSHGDVWSSGEKIQSGHFLQNDNQNQENVHKIEYFQGHKVQNIAAGDDFTIAIVKKVDTNDVESESNSSCPLGLPINQEPVILRKSAKKREKLQTESITEFNEDIEEKSENEPKIERLAQSGLYILNPSEAVKFLGKQMSWIGIGSPIKDGVQDEPVRTSVAEEASEEVFETENNAPNAGALTRASSFVSESMKFAVSKLSKSFTSEQKLDQSFDDISSMDPNSSSIIQMSTLNTSLLGSSPSPTKPKTVFRRLTAHRRSQSVNSNLNKLTFKIGKNNHKY